MKNNDQIIQIINTKDVLEVKYYLSRGFMVKNRYSTNDDGYTNIEYEISGMKLNSVRKHYLKNKNQIDIKTIKSEIINYYDERKN